jgi:hypothetical protein
MTPEGLSVLNRNHHPFRNGHGEENGEVLYLR